MSTYIVEITAIHLRGDGPVGHGVDDLGREVEIVLDQGLAADVAMALDEGRRPIVAVERGRPMLPTRSQSPRPSPWRLGSTREDS